MPYIYKDTVNIYDDEAIARAIHTQETQFQVLQGKISSLITDSELEVLRNGGSTMYSRMSSTEQTVEGITTQVSNIQTDLRDNRPTISSMNSAITQKATEITTSVNQTLQNYSTTSQMNTAIQQSANSITQTASQTYVTKTDYNTLVTRVGTAESKITPTAIINTVTSSDGVSAMVSSINQSADTVKIHAAHINLIGAVTANDLATGSVTADKIGAGAITTDKLAANAVTSAKIAANTITGDNIQAGSISAVCLDVNSIFAQDITATGTITGAKLRGADCEIEKGSIGGWTLVEGILTDTATETQLTGEALALIEQHTSQMYNDMYQPFQMIDTMNTTISGHGTTLSDHETRISALESAPLPANISCTTLTATGALSGDSLSVTHGITGVEIDLTGHVNAGNITGTDLYTQTSNAGTGSNAVITGTGRVAPTTASSKRYKDHISSVTLEQAMKVLDIPVINFKYKEGYLAKGDEMEGKPMPGFYAEDVYGLIPEAIYHDREGRVENWKERIILPLMLKVIQEQQHEIDELKRR